MLALNVLVSAKDTSNEYRDPLHRGVIYLYEAGLCHFYSVVQQTVTHCQLDVAWFPFDEQHCSLVFQSWKFSVAFSNLYENKSYFEHDEYRIAGEWELIGMISRLHVNCIFIIVFLFHFYHC